MAHQLGAKFHLPHGLCNALVLSHVIAFNATNAPTKQTIFSQYRYPSALRAYSELAEGLNLGGADDVEKTNRLIDALEVLKAKIGIKTSIKDYVAWEEFEKELDELALLAFDDQCTGANPRYPMIYELRQLFIDAFHGRPKQLVQSTNCKL
jgi:acetaldehyde dehydrogenase/alcohol dehydrogenase